MMKFSDTVIGRCNTRLKFLQKASRLHELMMLPISQIESNLFGARSCVISQVFLRLQISVLYICDSELFRPYILIFFSI